MKRFIFIVLFAFLSLAQTLQIGQAATTYRYLDNLGEFECSAAFQKVFGLLYYFNRLHRLEDLKGDKLVQKTVTVYRLEPKAEANGSKDINLKNLLYLMAIGRIGIKGEVLEQRAGYLLLRSDEEGASIAFDIADPANQNLLGIFVIQH